MKPSLEGFNATLLALTPTLLIAAVTIAGWYVTSAYARIREDRTRRLTTILQYKERQIAELYGPLLSLIEQIFNLRRVKQSLLSAENATLSHEARQKVDHYFWSTQFRPLHSEILELLRKKVYLLEGGATPPSFVAYFQHSVQESVQKELWDQSQIDTSFLEGKRWPRGFHDDVKSALSRLTTEHQGGLAGLAPEK